MTERFADTYVFLAMLNRSDRKHAEAVAALESTEPMVTTAWVLTELADGLSRAATRATFLAIEQRLRADRRVTIMEASQELYNRGRELYRQRPDKDWTLTDCISFVVMRERGIIAALTGDHHFEQAGFVAVLK